MGLFENSVPVCPRDQRCSEWAKTYMSYCLCGTKDVVSLSLGVISVLSWGVAEIPQIITNYNEKSTEGLSIMFLLTWILGDFLNLFGCKLEPATLPTQYYTAMLYTVTSLILAIQTIYYGHIYHRLKHSKRCHKINTVENNRQQSNDIDKKQVDSVGLGNRCKMSSSAVVLSSPIPLPAHNCDDSVEEEFYITSARSLSRSHTPTFGFHMQRRTSSAYEQNSIEEPLIGENVSPQSAPPLKTKPMLCVASSLTFFLSISNLQLEQSKRSIGFDAQNRGFVVQVGRKLLQVNRSLLQETGSTESSKIGSLLGWGMAAIYMGGRLPQIYLNFRRGNVQGLNPLMFVFALVGNVTYVASILVSSLDWSKIGPNLPWLVDAGGCVILDSLILLQFIYFWYRPPQVLEKKNESYNIN